jgi:peptidoglycan hydrolase-like protein with peptidoglycan-binding domain
MAWAQEENIVKAQRLLSALGYDPGIADGVLGPRTQQAIAAYQHAHNLPATGDLDELTLRALGLLAAPRAPEFPPAPTAPPAPWRPVLVYLRYYDTQPSRLVPYVTEHFRQGVQAQTWIENTMRDMAAQDFSRLSWQIERVEPQDSEAASEATVEVYSRVRMAGEESARREVFSLVRADKTTWLINNVQSFIVSAAEAQDLSPDKAAADRSSTN